MPRKIIKFNNGELVENLPDSTTEIGPLREAGRDGVFISDTDIKHVTMTMQLSTQNKLEPILRHIVGDTLTREAGRELGSKAMINAAKSVRRDMDRLIAEYERQLDKPERPAYDIDIEPELDVVTKTIDVNTDDIKRLPDEGTAEC